MSKTDRPEIILAIETAVGEGSLSLLVRNGKRRSASWKWQHGPISRAENLLSAVDDLLRFHGIAPADLDTIAVSTGPGSFTGIRIGMAAALGLAKAVNAKLAGFSVLRAMVELASGDIAAAAVPIGKLDAGIQFFEKKDGVWAASSSAESIAAENLAEAISSRGQGGEAIVHPGLAPFLSGRNNSDANVRFSGENLAELIARLASLGITDDSLEPQYLLNPARQRAPH